MEVFLSIYLKASLLILASMTILWAASVVLKDVSIVDLFWGPGFVLVGVFYFSQGAGEPGRKLLIVSLTAVWGLRLLGYLAWRNLGKGEDPRYREFRHRFGPARYWWVSFFQVFLLQGVLMWLISSPLLGAQYAASSPPLNWLDAVGLVVWLVGFVFEAGSDFQLARFKADPANRGQLLTTGFWRYTRHPNYFGDAAVWWGYGLICLAAGSDWPVLGSVAMTVLIVRVSGVALLEKTLRVNKPGYADYVRRTSAFFPWFPGKDSR